MVEDLVLEAGAVNVRPTTRSWRALSIIAALRAIARVPDFDLSDFDLDSTRLQRLRFRELYPQHAAGELRLDPRSVDALRCYFWSLTEHRKNYPVQLISSSRPGY